jgi:D-alanyl-D-alanine carboxypeptidase
VKNPLDAAELTPALDNVHRGGIPGVFAEVRGGDQVWRGAAGVAGVADVSTDRHVTPDMRHRVGSISKTFTAAAVLQQFENGRIGLDTPMGRRKETDRGSTGISIRERTLLVT